MKEVQVAQEWKEKIDLTKETGYEYEDEDEGHWELKIDELDKRIVVGGLNWEDKKIEKLPDSIGDLIVGGDLNLKDNELESLPADFVDVTVRGDLNLTNNKLETLPKNFGKLRVEGHIFLNGNKLNKEHVENQFKNETTKWSRVVFNPDRQNLDY